MALLKVTLNLHGLRNDAPSKVYAGSDMLTMLAAARATASDALPLVSSMEALEHQSRLQVILETGCLPPATPAIGDVNPAGTQGFVKLDIYAVVDDELAYRHRTPGSASYAYVQAVVNGMSAAFGALPDPAGFLSSLGINPADTQPNIDIGSSVVLFG